jgi:two-component system CheB/CheR fusion protein
VNAKKSQSNKKTKSTTPTRRKPVKKQTAAKSPGDGGVAKAKTKTTKTRKVANQPAAKQPSGATNFPIVGLGASAGGLEALEDFFRAMPADSGMAFVVVMHQAAKHVSLLPDLLDRCTAMDVAPIREGTKVQPNCVYVVPPGKHADVLNGVLHLTDLPPKHVAPLPIDYFFRSLADDRQETAVAIVLSGTGTDGTVGLSAIKGRSGMVMVQSVESAKFSGMPQAAINAGCADYVLPPDEMPRQLIAYARGPFLKTPRAVDTPAPGLQTSLPEILLLLRRRCGHDFSGYKPSTICRRIERRMNVHHITQPKAYLRYLDEHAAEAETLFKELLIGVTSFFRDPWAFESLAKHVLLPMLREKAPDSPFRVWVPGCATGEEAYSIAMLLRECMDELKIHMHVQIFATDLDGDAIETARGGLFAAGIGSDVSDRRLGQFFTKEDGSYRMRKELRDWLIFAPQNVIHDPPFTKLDLVSCRNLLIYLQGELQKKLLMLFHYSLSHGGCLFLGTSETIGDFGDLFKTIDNKAKLFRRKEAAPRPERPVEFPIKVAAAADDKRRPVAATRPPGMPVNQAVAEMLVACFAPPTVVVNDKGEIVHVHGRTGQFLELAPGGPPKDIVTMARAGLELDLSAALREAARQDAPVVHENVPVKTNGDTALVNLIVQRISDPESIRGLLRVSFQIVAAVAPPMPEEKSPAKSKSRRSSRDKELERELQHTRESLQRTIEERDASNEEMKSANEELQSTNEELQSTNEELETSKEELQSLNEELQTVNAEFQEKIHELSRVNDDMRNLLNSTDIATIFLDNRLCIKSYTEQARCVIRLIPTDLGRPLRDLTSHLDYGDLVADAEEVLKTLAFKECEVHTDEGRWLLLRLLPYRTAEDKIEGLVMTFIDIDELKRTQHDIQQARHYAESIVETVREPLVVLDGNLRVKSANRAFYGKFRVAAEQTVGRLIYDLGNGQWDIPTLRNLLEEILPRSSSFDHLEIQHDFPTIGHKHMLLNARRIADGDGEPNLILLAIEDVTP